MSKTKMNYFKEEDIMPWAVYHLVQQLSKQAFARRHFGGTPPLMDDLILNTVGRKEPVNFSI